MSDPDPTTADHDAERLQRRAARPAWLSAAPILSALALLGPVIYVCLFSYTSAYLELLGLTPEELGVSQGSLVVRAAAFTLVAAAILLVAVPPAAAIAGVFVFWAWSSASSTLRELWGDIPDHDRKRRVVDWASRADHVWASSPVGRLRRSTWAVVLGCTAAILAAGMLAPGALRPSAPRADVVGLTALLVVLLIGPLALWRHAAAVATAAVVTVGLLVSAAQHEGRVAARQVEEQAPAHYGTTLLGFPARHVCVLWAGGTAPSWLPTSASISLGATSDALVLTDGTDVYRVDTGLVDAITTPVGDSPGRRC